MKSFEEFKTFFDTEIREAITDLEARREAMYAMRLKVGLGAILLIFVHWIFTYLNLVPFYTIIASLIIFPVAGFYLYQRKFLDLTIPEDYKETVVKKTLEYVDPSLSYQADGHISYQEFEASRLFLLRPDDFKGDDLITGKIDGIPIRISELQVRIAQQKWFPLKKEPVESWKTIFGGIFLVAQYPKNLKTKIYILPNTLYKTMGFLGMLAQQYNLLRGAYVHTKNRKFRSEFVVYGEHILFSEQLLTEDLMQKLLLLKEKSHSDVYASLIGDKIYIALDLRREIFEVNTKKPLYNPNFIREFYNELYYIFSVIDDLNIDELELPGEEE